MAEEITATEAARRLGVTDKTLRKWIAQGKIQARRISDTRLALLVEDVTALAAELDKTTASDVDGVLSAISTRLSEIEYRIALIETVIYPQVEALETRVNELEAMLQGRAEKKHIAARERVTPASKSTLQPALPEMPPGETIELKDLATALGISRSTLHEFVMKQDLAHIAVEIPGRPGQYKRYFTTDQARAVKDARQ